MFKISQPLGSNVAGSATYDEGKVQKALIDTGFGERHRLSSCKFCDEILVFHEGTVVQQGSHEMLLAENQGKYYELWNAQAQYYQVGV